MEVTREFLEEHLAAMRHKKAQVQHELATALNQYDGAIAMALLALKRLDEPEEEPNAD